MLLKSALFMVLVFGVVVSSVAQENQASKPVDLDVLKESIGVWDAEIEV